MGTDLPISSYDLVLKSWNRSLNGITEDKDFSDVRKICYEMLEKDHCMKHINIRVFGVLARLGDLKESYERSPTTAKIMKKIMKSTDVALSGKWVHCAHLACLRNRDRPLTKQLPEIKALGDKAFDFQFEDSELLAKLIGDDTPEKNPDKYTYHCWQVSYEEIIC